ncbi:ras GTPase-activating-like protein IQGAP2 isoform X2 [Monodelphis domestica]|uniref:ras GTPase-activating-like protein IQGAP2 isoform X2 n=1 Tax=Monodelphis domestica TaxID=13616 RepID=UPI0024E1BCB2|nr:ras GTPase-activating-like protein IQGAP2 isoform X2 [Monodelphis domestica]
MALMKPEAQLPTVHPFAAVLYQDELFNLQKQSSLNYLSHRELSTTVEMVSGVALLNQALETEDLLSIQNHLQNPSIGFNNLDEEHLERYASRLMSIKREASSQGQDNLSQDEIQNHIDIIYVEIEKEKAMIAAVIAINQAIKKGISKQTLISLKNPKAVLTSVNGVFAENYQKELWEAKQRKEESAKVKNILLSEEERDPYEELLTQVEIQGSINKINRLIAINQINAVIREGHPSNTVMALMKPEAQLPTVHPFAAVLYQDELFNLQKRSSLNYLAHEELSITLEMLSAVTLLNKALETEDLVSIQNHLHNPSIDFNSLDEQYFERYASRLMSIKRKALSQGQDNLRRDEMQNQIDRVNVEIQEEKARLAAVDEINAVIREGHPRNTLTALMKPEAKLPTVHPFAAVLYQNELFNLQQQSSLYYLAHEELSIAVEVLSATALLNQALEMKDLVSVQNYLRNPSINFSNLDKEYLERYASRLVSIKRKASFQGRKNWTHKEIQNHIDTVSVEIQEEKARLAAVNEINAVIREGHPSNTVMALMKPEAKLPTVHPFAAVLYQDELFNLQKQSSLNYLAHEELSIMLQMLSAVALLNQALENEDHLIIQNHLRNPLIGFNNLQEEHMERYASRLMSIKREASSQGQDNLRRDEMQNHIDRINVEIEEEKARLTAVDEINAVIRKGHPSNTVMALMKPEAKLPTVHPFAAVLYQDELLNLQKQSSLNYLAHEELSITIEMLSAVALLNQALETKDFMSIQNHLLNPSIGFKNLDGEHMERYASKLMSIKREASSQGKDNLSRDEIQNQIDRVNVEIQEEKARLAAVNEINAVIRKGHPSNTMSALMKPEAQLPAVHPFAAVLYQNELFKLQKQSSLNYLTHEELSIALEMLSAITFLNLSLETNDLVSVQNELQNPLIGFKNLKGGYLERYASRLMSIKREASSQGQDNLSRNEIQNCIDMVNVEIKKEKARNAAAIPINKAIKEGISEQTLVTLKNPNAFLTYINDSFAKNYQKELWEAQQRKKESAKVKNILLSEEERDAKEEQLTPAEIQGSINKVNRLAAVKEINVVIQEGDPSNTMTALMKPEAQLPTVHPFAAVMYQDELFDLQKQSSLNYLAHEELSTTVEMLSAVALLNQALETEDLVSIQNHLQNPSLGFSNLDDEYLGWYARTLMSIKKEASSQGQDILSQNEMQNHIDMVYVEIKKEKARLAAVDEINARIREGHPTNTVTALMKPEAQLPTVHPFAAVLYQNELFNLQKQSSLNYLTPEELSKTVEMLSAIALLNQAMENKDLVSIQNHIKNPLIGFSNLDDEYLGCYTCKLLCTKTDSFQGHYLNRNEIQNRINMVNVEIQEEKARHAAVITINEAIKRGITEQTLVTLKNPNAVLISVIDSLAENYQKELWETKQRKEERAKEKNILLTEAERDPYEELLTLAEIQGSINKINRLIAVDEINAVIRKGDPRNTVMALMKPEAQLPTVHPFAAVLYQDELFNLQKQSSLNYLTPEELSMTVEMLSDIALLNQAMENKDIESIQNHLQNPAIGFCNVNEKYLGCYICKLLSLKTEASSQGEDNLSKNEIQNHIHMVNLEIQEEEERNAAIANINKAIDGKNHNNTLMALQAPAAKVKNVNPDNAYHYQDVLFYAKAKKVKSSDTYTFLWLEEIQAAIDYANLDVIRVTKWSKQISEINRCLENEDKQIFLKLLQTSYPQQSEIMALYSKNYYKALYEAQKEKSFGVTHEGSWLKLRLRDTYNFYYNIETEMGTWIYPEDFANKVSWLTEPEIKTIVEDLTSHYILELMWSPYEVIIPQMAKDPLVAQIKKQFEERKNFLSKKEPFVIKIQAFWRGYRQRKLFLERKRIYTDNVSSITELQSFRMSERKKDFVTRRHFFYGHLAAIVKIQACIRRYQTRRDYNALMNEKYPPMSALCKFSHLLNPSEKGLQEELELENLRQEVISKIKANQALEKDLNLMDIKIGLLVKNRITLQDVILQNKKLNKTKAEKIITMSGKQGIKSLSLEKRKKLEAYQHLFYILQTNPSYLAKLIFQVPQIKGTNFMNNAIFTLYNYASNEREEYLFLKFLKTALEEEMQSQVNQIQDIVNENATVSKMVINFSRGAIAQNALCQLIFPVVKEIIDDTSLAINTNPVDVYKTWINQSEVETGAISKLPYNIKKEQALSRAEIRAKLDESIETLQRVTDKILDIMFSSLDQIPYGMRYVAKMLKTALEEKFPNAPEDEILKIIGNFLYCQYMNPAIVTPDRFGLLDMIPGNQIFPVERKNLESVAQLLEHAASDKMFEGENDHLSSLNYYVSETFKKFRNFFKEVCNVPEPEDKFNIDEFTDIVTINKPTIYMTIEEIINIHSLLLEHKATIAPEKNDPLKELLADLREVPDIEAFLGEGSVDPNDPNKENTLNELLKTEISLSLSNKYDLKGENIDLSSLMGNTKKLIIDVIQVQSGPDLLDILQKPATERQELEYNLRMEKKILLASKIPEEMKSNQIMLDDAKLPLEEKKRKIQRNLQILEESGLVSEANKYQELLSEIAKDIRNQHACRERRRCELKKLRQTLEALNSKSIFFQDQINHYDAYIKTCLDNLPIKTTKKSFTFFRKERSSPKKAKPVKYTGHQLHVKGVLLDIEGLITKQFKNIMFHFIPGKEVGNFEIKTRSRDYEIEIVKLNIQDLLQMQYEGVTVMKIFGRVKMNVNLLIFLLNKKFYGK